MREHDPSQIPKRSSPCDKKKLQSRKEAKAVMRLAARGARMRCYFCIDCKCYHVTKQTKTGLDRVRDNY